MPIEERSIRMFRARRARDPPLSFDSLESVSGVGESSASEDLKLKIVPLFLDNHSVGVSVCLDVCILVCHTFSQLSVDRFSHT